MADGTSPLRTIAMINQKGGVGKTTTTVNIAAALASMGRRVLLVDLDPQAHASLHLGVSCGPDQASIYEVLIDPDAIDRAVIPAIRPGLALIPSRTDLAAAEGELADAPDRLARLGKALSRLENRHEFILIDCPPSLGILTLNALAAVREVFIPMQAHFLALQGVGKLLETVAMVARSINPRLRVTGVVLCMHDASSTHTREVVSDIEQFFEQARTQDVPWRSARVYRPAIRRNIKLAECPSFGQSILEYAPDAPGSADYKSLAAAIAREWDAMLAKRAEIVVREHPDARDPARDSAEASA